MNNQKQQKVQPRDMQAEVLAKKVSGPQNLQSYVSLLYSNTSETNAYYDNDY